MSRIHNKKQIIDRRKELRNNSTDAEKRLWYFLKNKQLNGRKFTRQHSIGKYIVDFYCSKEQLIIELDGDQHNDDDQKKHDEIRTKYLESLNKRVIRFTNMDVLFKTDIVLKEIEKHFRN